MNLKEFLKEVEECLMNMTEIDKNEFILHQARILKETQRDIFLKKLKNEEVKVDFTQEITDFEKWIVQVQQGSISYSYRYEWDPDARYGEPDEVLIYEDSLGISAKLSRALQVADSLIQQKDYHEAAKIYELLLNCSYTVFSEELDESELFCLANLIEEDLMNANYPEILIRWLYVVYQTKELPVILEEFYEILSSRLGSAISLDRILAFGPEKLLGIEEYLEKWIFYLEDRPQSVAGTLLYEASAYLGGTDQVVIVAERAGDKHPFICVRACEMLFAEQRNQECETLGVQWMNLLPRNLILRAKICDWVRKAAELLGHDKVERNSIVEAFYSDSTIPRFLQLFRLSDYEDIVKKATRYSRMLPEQGAVFYAKQGDELATSTMSAEHKIIIEFFSGDLEKSYQKYQRSKEFLGWSTSVEGVLIPLFILTLNTQSELTVSGGKLWQDVCYKLAIDIDDEEMMLEGFLRWKQLIKIKPEAEKKYLEWLNEMVSNRVEAVVGGGFRRSYHKAALLIENYGELIQSKGSPNGRTNTIEYYIKKYPRKRAFKEEFFA